MPWEPGTVSVDHLGQERWVVELSGEHDLSTVGDLRESLEAIFAQGTLVVIDLSAATFIDSSILGELVRAQRRVDRDSGEQLAVVAPAGGFAARLFGLVGGLDTLVRMFGVARRCAALVRGCDATFARVKPSGRRIPADVRERILDLRAKGMSRNGIAELFSRQGVPRAAGGRRYTSTIRRVTDSAAAVL